MNRIAILLLLIIAGAMVPASAQTAEELKLKTLSRFTGSKAMRDPFWPIGWKKEGAATPIVEAAATTEEMPLKPENFVVTSISLATVPLAVINGRVVAEGEVLPARIENARPVNVQVFSIRDGAVTMRYGNKMIIALMKEVR